MTTTTRTNTSPAQVSVSVKQKKHHQDTQGQKKEEGSSSNSASTSPTRAGSPRSTHEELQSHMNLKELKEEQKEKPQKPAKKKKKQQEKSQPNMNGSSTSTSTSSRPKCKFSSNQEEPIVMSRTAMATVLQDVHFSEAEDPELQIVRMPTLVPPRVPLLASILQILRRCTSLDLDVAYSTSSLTRHTSQSYASPFPQFLAFMLQDFIAKLTLKTPLRSPFVLQRIMGLLWHGGPHKDQHLYNHPLLLQNQPPNHFSSSPQYTPSVEGIPNYGQTCFLNAVLQSLASLDSLLAYAQWIAQEQQTQPLADPKKRHKPTPPTTTVSQLLLPLLKAINGQTHSRARQDPRELLWRIAQKNPQFQSNRHHFSFFASSACGEQQDAQELLQALLEMMIVDAHLGDSYTSHNKPVDLHELAAEEKKDDHDDDDDEVLTVLSDRYPSRVSSNTSLCSSVDSGTDETNNIGTVPMQMVDATGMMASYEKTKATEQPYGLASSLLSSSLESSFLSTTSTVVTSPSRQPPQTQSPSMQIMLSTISSITKTPLSCWTGSLVQCQACHHNRAIRNQEWRDIPVVPTAISVHAAGPCTLHDCLRHFTQVERVSDVECGNCTLRTKIRHWQGEVELLQDACQSVERRQQAKKSNNSSAALQGLQQDLAEASRKLRQLQQQDPDEYTGKDDDGDETTLARADALKCLVLTRLPSVLCLHVQRRYYDPMTSRMSKTTQHVEFPEWLDLSPYCAYGGGNANAQSFFASQCKKSQRPSNTTTKPIWYRLTSVIVHQGNAFGGHYVCYRRLPAHLSSSSDQWHYCSDNVVQLVGWEQVRRAQAYMLFYEAM